MGGFLQRRTALGVKLAVTVLLVAVFAGAWVAVHQAMPGWYARAWYTLEHEDLIRENARRYNLDPALIAGVIATESRFVHDSRSVAGAVGLMQLLPETARFVATLPKRPSPPPHDLDNPRVNIAYGSAYLRYLIDKHHSLPMALAAYNAGEGNVQRWRDEADAEGRTLRWPDDVPFGETRAFVTQVLRHSEIYRSAYGDRLGPPPPGWTATP